MGLPIEIGWLALLEAEAEAARPLGSPEGPPSSLDLPLSSQLFSVGGIEFESQLLGRIFFNMVDLKRNQLRVANVVKVLLRLICVSYRQYLEIEPLLAPKHPLKDIWCNALKKGLTT